MSDAKQNRITRKRGRSEGAKGALPAMVIIALRLPNDLVDQIDEWGAERGMTRSASLRRWIENGVTERWKPPKLNAMVVKPTSRQNTSTGAAMPPKLLIAIPINPLRRKNKRVGSASC